MVPAVPVEPVVAVLIVLLHPCPRLWWSPTLECRQAVPVEPVELAVPEVLAVPEDPAVPIRQEAPVEVASEDHVVDHPCLPQ